MNKVNLNKMVDEKFISVQKHPSADLYIFNYTQKAQFDRMWNEETLSCRGLIMDDAGNIIARPFKKFFNLEEEKNLPAEDFEVFDKLDGSLGILYFIGDTPYIATRGSFTSDQALKATEILRNKYSQLKFDKALTYLFEIIYPQNRIVVNYEGVEDLFLLAIIHTKSGDEYSYEYIKLANMPVVKRYDGISDLTKIKELQEDNKEGFVIRFKSGKRVKIKFEEYVRLHRLITGVNARRIWDMLRNDQPLDELLERVPDEFYAWVKDTVKRLKSDFAKIELSCSDTLNNVQLYKTRKEQAEVILKNDYTSVVFQMLDGKDYRQAIWGYLKPKHEVPFKIEI